ncbi:Uncharacterised protein [Mycobacteroides abscessus subsp. abscessus]|uniref:hypothetical protein n=1 Tax=Mycobacteroides abscessus TaxID=36809 RepID=UPI00092AAD81|nr:hypothetical protein [Mycobacteroides abscessus]SHQ43018.1 Uncharacterised protein [Mycobacteroides abscessus subsp. abscessus]SHQ51214.1 Uncharacterised protein [Mycobacteroides abscessus subsp. abscessus]SLL30756.1 Uncharacterised protein [Mycobacteroides abscessus subsp. abscessus]
MSTTTAVVTIVGLTVVGFYLLVAYIVNQTGSTDGIADIGRAVAAIIRALTDAGAPPP